VLSLLSMTHKQIHDAKMRAARRKLRRKHARWGDKAIVRGSGKGGGHSCSAPQRTHMTASQLWRKHG